MLKKIFNSALLGAALVSMSVSVAHADEVKRISGAGSSFAFPIYSKWSKAYATKTGVQMNYQSIGSGAGIKAIIAKTVDFGASDAPLKEDALKKDGLMQFPMAMGGVVPVVHIKGIKAGEIHLDGTTLADIYLGKIKKWNDSAIKKLNRGVHLPNKPISVVYRSDGSGTTWIYTNYLTKVSKEWADKVGNNKAVKWPVGSGGKGNAGVASYVKNLDGSIGYVEYAYALQNKMSYVMMKNKAGKFVGPTSKNFQAAASHADWKNAPGFYMVLTDQPGADSWPITGATFVLVHTSPEKPANVSAVLKFFNWSYENGAEMAKKLDYVPMPASVVKMVQSAWTEQVKGTSWK